MKNLWVKEARQTEGWSVAELARRVGIASAALDAIERGETLAPAVAAAIRDAIKTARRERAARAIRRLPGSRRDTERLLNLSPGYLSRLAAGAGNPSAALTAALTLLANDPRRIAELDHRDARPLTHADLPPAGSVRASAWGAVTASAARRERGKIAEVLASQTGEPGPGGPHDGQA